MSRAHEIFGTVAQYFEQGGEWGQGARWLRRNLDTHCAGEVIDTFVQADTTIPNWELWAQVHVLWRREMGNISVAAYNDLTVMTKEKIIETFNAISESPGL